MRGVIEDLFRSKGVAECRFLLVLLELDLVERAGVFLEELVVGVSGSVGQLGDHVVVELADGFLEIEETDLADKDDLGVLVQGSVDGSVQASDGGPPGVKVVLVAIEDPDLVIEFSSPKTFSLHGRIDSGEGVLKSRKSAKFEKFCPLGVNDRGSFWTTNAS